jgi:radical SAM-linked protein
MSTAFSYAGGKLDVGTRRWATGLGPGPKCAGPLRARAFPSMVQAQTTNSAPATQNTTEPGVVQIDNPPPSKRSFSPDDWEGATGDLKTSAEAWAGLKAIIPHKALSALSKPGQYLGNEFGAIRKDWDAAEVRFVLAYPDAYSIGMSSTGHVVLYSCLNEPANLLCDRAYLPLPDMQSFLKDAGKPLFAVESKRPLGDFHVIGMSISYELTATNCLQMMDLANIPLTSQERAAAIPSSRRFLDGHPLVFAGGLSVTANPEPYADFFDFIALGDGEIALPAIGQKIATVLRADPNVSREDLLLALARDVPGVYVPEFYEMDPVLGSVNPCRPEVPPRPQRQNAQPEPWRAMALVPHVGAVHDRLSIEIRRGCTRGCRFCLPGMVQRPARDVAPDTVVDAVTKGVAITGYNEFSLLSLSCSDWLSLPSVGLRLKNELADQNISLSLGSQRVDRFDVNIARVQGGLRKSGVTFAPEAGSQRMRDVINKGLTNEDLLRGVKTAYEQGWQNVKLYFMIGLPGETDEDVVAIADTVKYVQKKCRMQGRRRLSVNLTISSFTPKRKFIYEHDPLLSKFDHSTLFLAIANLSPSCHRAFCCTAWTPFQWHSVSTAEFARKQNLLKKEFRHCGDVKVNYTDKRLSSMEEFIGRGDRRLSKVIRRAYELGAGMDAWWEAMDKAYNAWCQAIDECGLTWKYRRTENGEWNIVETPPEDIRGKRGWRDIAKTGNLDRKTLLPKADPIEQNMPAANDSPLDRPLPWDHIDVGLDKGWLRDELMRALSETLTPDCAFDECSACGVCGEDLGNNIAIPCPPIPKYEGPRLPSTAREQRVRLVFKSWGAMALSSHLDTQRMLDQLMRRASLPISFDGGFHPHPKIIAAAPLPFGSTADEEPIDFFLAREMAPEEFAHRVNSGLPDGMCVVSAQNVPIGGSAMSALTTSADYLIAVYRDFDLVEDGEIAVDWDEAIRNLVASGPIEVEKINKKGVSTVRNLRDMLLSVRIASAEEAEPVLTHIGLDDWPRSGTVLAATLKLSNDLTLSPSSFVNMLRISSGDERIMMLHAHRCRILLSEDERYNRVAANRALEEARLELKVRGKED